MNIYITENIPSLNQKAANIIAAQIIMKPDSVLGLATGSTPIGTYELLVEYYNKGVLDFTKVTTINLDEYQGLAPDHDQSYRYFMDTHLFNQININKNSTFLPNGLAKDSNLECQRYNQIIQSLGGIDLQLLGIGENAHIGFNEPGTEFKPNPHLVTLTEKTRQANSRFFPSIDDVPTHAYTMGIKNILSAKKILLLASGTSKAKALYHSFLGPITPAVPASILQLHNNVTIIADSDALALFPQSMIC